MNINNSKISLLVIAVVSITVTFLLAYVSVVLNTDKYPESFSSIWNIWDAQQYIKIAESGYTSSTVNERHLLIAFFPFYPLLIKLFSFIFQSYLISGLVVSNIAYTISLFYLYKLVLIDFDKDVAFRSVIYLSVFPTAYFLHAVYTESLFIALTIASFYYARNDRWAIAGVLGMLATMTRITGIILLPILLVEYLHQRDFKKENIRKDITWIFVIGLGFLVYLLLNYITYGNPLKFLEIQSGHWNMNLTFPVNGFIFAFSGIFRDDPGYSMTSGWFQVVFGLLGYILVIYSFFRLRLSYSLYALITWLVVTSTSFWLSIPRFLVVVFPIFIALALLGRRREINYAIILTSVMLYALLLSQFVEGKWIF